MKKLKVILISICFFAGAFSAVSLVFYFGDWWRLIFVSFMGVCVGLVAAPSIEPKAFKNAWAYEISFGALAGAIVPAVFAGGAGAIAVGALLGGMLGYLAPYWIKHIDIP